MESSNAIVFVPVDDLLVGGDWNHGIL